MLWALTDCLWYLNFHCNLVVGRFLKFMLLNLQVKIDLTNFLETLIVVRVILIWWRRCPRHILHCSVGALTWTRRSCVQLVHMAHCSVPYRVLSTLVMRSEHSLLWWGQSTVCCDEVRAQSVVIGQRDVTWCVYYNWILTTWPFHFHVITLS